MSDVNQDDIDKLLMEALGGGGDAPAEPAADAPAPAPEPAAAPAAGPDLDGVASQDDIDALFAAVGGPAPEAEAPAPAPAPTPEPVPPPAPEPLVEEGIAGQDDIDAMFNAANAAAAAPAPEPAAPEPDPAAAEDATADDIDALLSSIADAAGEPAAAEQAPAPAADDFDMDALLKEVSDAAPPPPPKVVPEPTPPPEPEPEPAPAPAPAAAPVPPPAAPAPAPQYAAPAAPLPMPPMPQLPPMEPGQRQEYSILSGAGEVEAIANQISVLTANLSEKANRYMQAWATADAEARELRRRALAEEHHSATLASEKDAIAKELESIRLRIGELEGAKLGWEESRRTLETSYQAKIRELESQVKLLDAETDQLKNELTRARNQATGVDIESRRARFEADRLKNEVESEKMERLRIQRALENREKEIQALQSQSAGQASSLFIDELHRLVRRLESELDARGSGANQALRQLDLITDPPEQLVPILSNVRASVLQAAGQHDHSDDAIKALGRDADGVRGPAAIEPAKSDLTAFETDINTWNLAEAMDIAGTLLREAKATPTLLMRKIYQCQALRRPETGDYMPDLARLLDGLRMVQESADRARGKETGESEIFYVMLFDFLHNLVRLKLLNRMSGDAWRLFLDLRGRFSFVASDKQWIEYRDNALAGK